MLIYEKFEKKHIPDVKELFDKYLVPIYLKRMGITKEEITNEIIEMEDILDPNVTSDERYQECSVVCVNKSNNKVVACCMNYFLNESEYNEMYVESYKRFLL